MRARDLKRLVAVAALSLCIAGGVVVLALAAGPPAATTGSASNVTDSAATVIGAVNPNGESTTYSFQFGTTTAYDSQTDAQSAGSGTSALAVSRTITGLHAQTRYHYRLTATNAPGRPGGGDRTSTPAPPPPPPATPPPAATTSGADRIGRREAKVHGTVNPHGARTTYYFEFGLTSAYGFRSKPGTLSSGTSPRPVSAALRGLQSGATYHYRLVARNANGVGLGTDLTFTTSRPPNRRGLPQITIAVRPPRDRRPPFRFTVRGKLIRPSGFSRSRSCHGLVTIRFKLNRRTVRLRHARVSRKCRFRARVRVRARRHPRTFLISVRFGGNTALKPRSAPPLTARAG
jgi:hypothetical protein